VKTSGRAACLETDGPNDWFFDTLQSNFVDGWATIEQQKKAHERRLCGSTTAKTNRSNLKGENVKRDAARGHWVTPAHVERTHRMH
jgi:hypothetical protein